MCAVWRFIQTGEGKCQCGGRLADKTYFDYDLFVLGAYGWYLFESFDGSGGDDAEATTTT
jgi:hypothetical protein